MCLTGMTLKIHSAILPACLLLWTATTCAAANDEAAQAEPPRFEVPVADAKAPLTFVAYGDTRFTTPERDTQGYANADARRALVAKIAADNPAAILIGGDLVYQGNDPQDYAVYESETAEWSRQKIPVFSSLGNHEFRGCDPDDDDSTCLENWWQAFDVLHLKPYRWYSVAIGQELLVLLLDSDSGLRRGGPQRSWFEQEIAAADPRFKFILIVMHYPPVRDPVYPRAKDEAEIARYLAKKAGTLHAQVIVIASHVHNYERRIRNGVVYLVSGGGGAKPVRELRLFGGELSKLKTPVNFHYIRFTLENERLTGTMVRFEANDRPANPWSEPDRFTVTAKP
jgi:acid phosphatase type 7